MSFVQRRHSTVRLPHERAACALARLFAAQLQPESLRRAWTSCPSGVASLSSLRRTYSSKRSALVARISSIRWSTLFSASKRWTSTVRTWPMRWQRAMAWSSMVGFHCGSARITTDPAWMFSPTPPAWISGVGRIGTVAGARAEMELGVPVRTVSPAANGGDLVRASLVRVSPRPYGCGVKPGEDDRRSWPVHRWTWMSWSSTGRC